MIALFVLCRLLLAATFLVSASGKFIGGGDQLGSALRLSVPRPVARLGASAVTPLEFVVAALLLFGNEGTFEIGLVAAAGLLLVFTGWMISVLLRGLEVECSCFGPTGVAVGWRSVARNALLVSLALADLMVMPSGGGAIGTSLWSALALAACAVLVILAVAMRRAIPALALSLEQVRQEGHKQGEDAYAG
ncbi:MAG TPA: MauE/DoxX family redox-associated membrane protein [Gaiellaceae bacterium]|nr:MauE/DoxX family redox-associated membrane protein [Gaiellaceae bacterium]